MNVFDFAMQTELDNKAHYEKLKAETPVDGLKKIFSILAAEELMHYNFVKAVKTGMAAELADSDILENVKNIFQDLQVDQGLLDELRTRLDGYHHAMKIEAESIRFYEEIALKERNPTVIQLLLRIVAEEKKHYTIVGNIHELIAGYESFRILHKFGKPMEI